MEIRRFGPGHRRPDGPPGTQGVAGQTLHHDGRAAVTELAFGRYAMITPHTNPNATLFVVISGGGYVQVGDERARVNHGEAVLWPADVMHGAYTDGTEMRAIVIELGGSSVEIVEGKASADAPVGADGEPGLSERAPTPAKGSLAERQVRRDEYDSSEGEPW